MMLTKQYRMASSICEWPSKYFYGGKLVTAEGVKRTGPYYEYRVLNVTDGDEQPTAKSFINEKEAAVVVKIVKMMLNSSLSHEKSIGVITFYQGQVDCIKRKIIAEDISLNDVEVDTVDSFQGREKDIVVVSCVRARGQTIGFVSSFQRINVALTRAKVSLIVCGHATTLKKNVIWNHFAENATRRDVVKQINSQITTNMLSSLLVRPVEQCEVALK